MNEFLRVEYEKCLDLLKHYDERHLSLVKFTTGISSSAISVVFGFHTFGSNGQLYFWQFAALLTGITALGLFSLFVSMVQNRLYFIYPARQVNAIRAAMVKQVAAEFSDNQMYVSTNVRAFKFLSLHTLMNFLVVLQVAGFSGFAWFSAHFDQRNVPASLMQAIALSALTATLLFVLSSLYLIRSGGITADHAIHSVKPAFR